MSTTPDVVSLGDYLLGCAGLAAVLVSLALAATRLRARLLPAWSGAPARLAETILALGLLIIILELLGIAGILTGPAIAAATAIAAAAIGFGVGGARAPASRANGGPDPSPVPARSAAGDRAPPTPRIQLALAAAISLLLLAQWTMPTMLALDRGIYGGDSLWYHLPFAAEFARSGSITALQLIDPLYLNWFYPQNSELLHAAGITLFGNDFLSPLLNLGWLGLALLAAWCIGRPYGAGAISLTGVAILLSADLMFSRQPGNANNDVAALALLLAAVALLVVAATGAAGGAGATGRRSPAAERDGPGFGSKPPFARFAGSRLPAAPAALIAAGLAAGLAVGTKLTVLIPVAALTVGVFVLVGRERWRMALLAWFAPLLAGGGFWYMRNLIVAGNPLPWAKLGIGPVALPRSEELEGRDPFSIADYATDGGVWRHYFFPGLNERFGELWPAVLALAALGVVLVAIRGARTERILAGVAVITAIAYVLTPLSASGQEGAPLGFRLNLRYLAPALAIGLALLAAPAIRLPGRDRISIAVILAFLLAVLFGGHSPLAALDDGQIAAALAIAAAAAAVIALALLWARGPGLALAALALVALALASLGWPRQEDYEANRYALDAPGYPREEHPGAELAAGLGVAYEWARQIRDTPIALGGTTGAFFQYGLYGPDSSNRVRYLGDRGARGSFDELFDCKSWRAALNEGGYRFVVTTPGYEQDNPERPLPAPFTRWTRTDPAAVPVLVTPLANVFRITGALDPDACE